MTGHLRFALALLMLFALGGCSILDRVRNIGKAPDLTPIENPVRTASYQPVSLPMPIEPVEAYPANSLWRRGARSFFKDLRARRVGDVLTVEVTSRTRPPCRTKPRASVPTPTTSRPAPSLATRPSSTRFFPTRSTPTIWSSSKATC